MESFFSRYKNALVLIVVLVAQLLALAVQVKRPAPGSPDQEGVSLIRYVVVSVVTPPERWAHNIGRGIRGIWFGYMDLVHVRQDDARLKTEIERLRLEQASLAEDAKQGQRLQQLLDFREHYVYKTVAAQVIGASGTDQSRTLYVDKGAKDGLAPDMPVVTADGIVGKLKDVFDHKSLVLLVSDPTSGVGVILETTRTRGILKGVPFGQLQVINVSPDERIKAGQRIVTSGGDQIFPRGMPVGTVQGVTPDPDRDPLMDVSVQPAANLSSLEEVLVITNVGDTLSKQAQKDLAESEAEGAEEKKRASDVLSERLPGRLDAKAPADTNPDPKVGEASAGNTAEDVRLLTPPRPLRPDQYSPDATPQAAEMTPGQRRAPVVQGTEDIVAPAIQKKAVTASATTETGSAAHTGTVSGDSAGGTVKKTPAASTTSTTATSTAKTTPSAVGARPASANAVGGGSATGSAATGSAVPGTKPVRPVSSTATQGSATGAVATGSAVPGPKPVKPVNGSATQGSTTASQAGGSSRPLTSATTNTASSSAGGGGTIAGPPKTKVVVDGPITGPSTRPRVVESPESDGQATVPAKKKSPEIVPDDGSRPPSAGKPAAPKPKQAVQPAETTPPNGGR
jgi:rod shape-determining protein MreC